MDISIRAIQKSGVQAVAKHFLANEQETQRTNTTVDGIIIDAVSTNLDDRTLHELYLWPFADSVRAGASSMMCSYNRLNQTYACEHPELLTSILKEELGFRGWVVSDWYATHAGAASANAGLDMEMPGPISDAYASYFGSKLKRYIEDGSLTENRLDQMAERVLAPYYLLGQDTGFPTLDPSTFSLMNNEYRGWGPAYGLPEMPGRDVRGNHSALIRSIGAAGTVLLKNIDGILPLVAPKNIGVFGNDAGDLTEGFKSRNPAPPYGFEYGTLNNGGGAASTHQTSLVSPLEAIKKKAEAIGALVQYTLSNERISANDFRAIYPTLKYASSSSRPFRLRALIGHHSKTIGTPLLWSTMWRIGVRRRSSSPIPPVSIPYLGLTTPTSRRF